MMNGCELSPFGFVNSFWVPKDYGKQLAEELGCPTADSWRMLECLRDNKTYSWQSIYSAQRNIKAKVRCDIFYNLNFLIRPKICNSFEFSIKLGKVMPMSINFITLFNFPFTLSCSAHTNRFFIIDK